MFDRCSLKTILIVDDAMPNRALLKKVLSPDYKTLEAENGRQALDILRSASDICLVVLDLMMPVLDGYGVLQQMKEDEELCKIPVVIVTASDDPLSQIRAFDLGAVDVINKPFNPQIVFHRVHNIVSRKESETIAEQNRLYERERREADFDKLTGLFSRQGFYSRVRARLDADPAGSYVLIRLDLDRFKAFNDTFGTKAGDKLLQSIVPVVLPFSSESTIFGRIEADHFAALTIADNDVARQIDLAFRNWLANYPTDFRLSASVGIFRINDKSLDVSLMCDRALMALRTVKNSYSDKIAFYSDAMRLAMLDEQTLTDEMDAALANGQFEVFFQPQMDYSKNCLIGAEALVRWRHPTRGLIPPDRFIPLFEKNGFISKLDKFMWEQSCACLQAWRNSDKNLPQIHISVNISRVDIFSSKLCQTIKSLVDKYGLSPSDLHLEITEGVYMENSRQLFNVVRELQSLGFTVEMDDFGSGYSSLNMLKDIPVDVLKLDMCFLSSDEDPVRSGSILSSVIRMAHWLHMPVIAEGVETRLQADYLKNLGACYMQGYYFGKPMTPAEFEALLERSACGPADLYKRTKTDGMASFWDSSSINALLFNTYVGGAIIVEYYNSRLEAICVNDEFYKTVGVSREEFDPYRFNLLSRVAPDYLSEAKSLAAAGLKSDGEYSYDIKFLSFSKNEDRVWLHLRGRLLAESVGRYLIYLSVENITERKQMERQLFQDKKELECIINAIPGGASTFEVHRNSLKLVYFSGGIPDITGISPDEYDSRVFSKKNTGIVKADEKQVLDAIIRLIRNGAPLDISFRALTQKGSLAWINVQGSIIGERRGYPLLSLIFQNISSD